MHETTSTHETAHAHKKPRDHAERSHGTQYHAPHPAPPHEARRPNTSDDVPESVGGEAETDATSRDISALQRALAQEVSKFSPHEDVPREAPAEPVDEQAPFYGQGVQGSGEEELSEESEALLAIEAEEPRSFVAMDVPEEVVAETEIEPEIEVEPSVIPSPDTEVVEEVEEVDVETTPISVEETSYQPTVGDLADLRGERVRLERPLEAGGEQVGFEVIKRDGTTDFVPNEELAFVDPAVEKIQTQAELTRMWASQSDDIKEKYRPSYIDSLWKELYGNTINRGVDASTDLAIAERKRGSNRMSLIAGQVAFAITLAHTIQSRGQFVLDNDAVTSEKRAT